jgi:large subunit ribosomal protein L4
MKPRPQKKSGRARQGNKRAPHLWKGGKAHGPKPMDYSFPLNEKVRLFALKSLLSARLYEEKIILIDDEKIPYAKTVFLNEIIKQYQNDKLLFLTDYTTDPNFMLA